MRTGCTELRVITHPSDGLVYKKKPGVVTPTWTIIPMSYLCRKVSPTRGKLQIWLTAVSENQCQCHL